MFDIMLTGVGGEGVLTAGTILARAAQNEGNFVRGVQLHGLAQRGGSIPTFVRYGKKIHSPAITPANANLIIAFEPLEALRATYYANRKKTIFILNNWPHVPINSNIAKVPYPDINEIKKRIMPFAKNVLVFETHKLSLEKFGTSILGNTMLIGAAIGCGALPLKERTVRDAIKSTISRQLDSNLTAFDIGVKMGRESKF
ncbi:2-oxoacid:acceptor oxidoreductase family protein [Candidatus Micrarchaeota archaeon]|nr:2-oxoacid:acceptor oxidoreductase family protein [Candidatus Micrarchaeota archaeon]